MEAQIPGVHSDPDILGGTPVFVGTRVPVKALLDYLEHGRPLAGQQTKYSARLGLGSSLCASRSTSWPSANSRTRRSTTSVNNPGLAPHSSRKYGDVPGMVPRASANPLGRRDVPRNNR